MSSNVSSLSSALQNSHQRHRPQDHEVRQRVAYGLVDVHRQDVDQVLSDLHRLTGWLGLRDALGAWSCREDGSDLTDCGIVDVTQHLVGDLLQDAPGEACHQTVNKEGDTAANDQIGMAPALR